MKILKLKDVVYSCKYNHTTPYKFSDRKSALNFKKTVLGNIEMSKDVRVLFIEYSTGEEWKKLLALLKNFPINQLYLSEEEKL